MMMMDGMGAWGWGAVVVVVVLVVLEGLVGLVAVLVVLEVVLVILEEIAIRTPVWSSGGGGHDSVGDWGNIVDIHCIILD